MFDGVVIDDIEFFKDNLQQWEDNLQFRTAPRQHWRTSQNKRNNNHISLMSAAYVSRTRPAASIRSCPPTGAERLDAAGWDNTLAGLDDGDRLDENSKCWIGNEHISASSAEAILNRPKYLLKPPSTGANAPTQHQNSRVWHAA